jgi:hypothetical protein
MKSANGGKSCENKGIYLEELQQRLILFPLNISTTSASGVVDSSTVARGEYLYPFMASMDIQVFSMLQMMMA